MNEACAEIEACTQDFRRHRFSTVFLFHFWKVISTMGCLWWEFLAVNPAQISALLIWRGLLLWETQSFDSSREFTQKKCSSMTVHVRLQRQVKRSQISVNRRKKVINCSGSVMLVALSWVCLLECHQSQGMLQRVKNRLLLRKLTTNQSKTDRSIQGLVTFARVFWTKLGKPRDGCGVFSARKHQGQHLLRIERAGLAAQPRSRLPLASRGRDQTTNRTLEMLLGKKRILNVSS